MVQGGVLEVEAKVRVAGFGAVRRRLQALGATPGAQQVQEDLFFRHPSRDFAATDEALRLRKAGGRLELTYKGPKASGPGAKARVEHTLALTADPTALLAGLGFVPALRLSKRRQPWRLGDIEVALDDLDGVGTFVEVEAQGSDQAAARAAVAKALQALGLDALPQLSTSYLELAVEAGVARPG